MDDELESQRIEKEIAALLQKKAAAELKEQQREKVETVRRANILVENSPVKKKVREYDCWVLLSRRVQADSVTGKKPPINMYYTIKSPSDNPSSPPAV